MRTKQVTGAYNSRVKKTKIVAWCKLHRCCLTPNQIKLKGCLVKQCRHLLKYLSHQYWKDRERIKELRKKRKENIKTKLEGIYNK